MIGRTRTGWRARLLLTASAAALALIALTTISSPTQARAWVSVGLPYPGYYYPGPYYGYPPPYAYAPPPSYYYPPDYASPGAYPPAAAPSAYTSPSAYTPGAPTPSYAPPAGGALAPSAMAAPAAPAITYTSKPAFTNAAGQTCREYKTTDATAGRDVFGTACREADGQWRVVN
ncbi:MAG TPA: hypothetical protein VN900_11305 [Stellaceae bacterium]|jgi:hypothetical protein|nr:hypothetical protein [Stellaceae bacterium]